MRNGAGATETRRRITVLGGTAALMLLPLLVLRMLDETAWETGDLGFVAVLLAGVGIANEVAMRVSDRSAFAAAVVIAVGAALLNGWINLAVGIIGSEDNAANLMYLGVVAVGLVGALIARFQPDGMARAMVATAIAQALVFAIAVLAGWGFTGPITVFFVALWLIAASLFRKAAQATRREALPSAS